MNINDTNVRMELDSGSPVSLMPTSLFREHFPQLALQQADLQLSTFTGEALKVLGFANVTVKYEQQTYSLKIYVVDAGRTPLFGRDWLQHIHLNWKDIHCVNALQRSQSLTELKSQFAHLFDNDLGKIPNFEAKLYVKEDSASLHAPT